MFNLTKYLKKTIDVAQFSQELEKFGEKPKLSGSVSDVELANKAGSAYKLFTGTVLQNIPEEEVWRIAEENGLEVEAFPSSALSFDALVMEVFLHTRYTNQWGVLGKQLELIRPSLNWTELIENVHRYYPSPPLNEHDLQKQRYYFQTGVLLAACYSYHEIEKMVATIDHAYDWRYPPYSYHLAQFTAVAIVHLMQLHQMPALVTLMKARRPLVPIIQQFNYIEESQFVPPDAPPNQLFLMVQAKPLADLSTSSLTWQELAQALRTSFSRIEIQEICQDADLAYDYLAGRNKEEKVTSIVQFIEKMTLDNHSANNVYTARFAAACTEKSTDIPWAEMMGLEPSSLPAYSTLSTDGYHLGAFRQVMNDCLPDNTHLFEFINAHLPYFRKGLSVKRSSRENILEIIEWSRRRGQLDALAQALATNFPE